jgi:hypothetical protein
MFEIRVYYHDVLRYTIVGNWDKVQELRNSGFNVQVQEAPGQGSGSGGWRTPTSFEVNGRDDAIVDHDHGYSTHILSEMRPDVEHRMLSYY